MEKLSNLTYNLAVGGYFLAFAGYFGLFFVTDRLKKRLSMLPAALTGVAFLIQLTSFALRWIVSQHAPVVGFYETMFKFSMMTALAFLLFGYRYRFTSRGFFPLGIISLIAAVSLTPDRDMAPLVPALDTPLFTWHIIFSFAAYGASALGGAIVLDRLIRSGRHKQRLPYDRILKEINFWVFILFSLCMLVGGVWAFVAWGSYWAWKPKGLWSGALWAYYAAVVHLPYQGKWRGKWVTISAAGGFILMLMTFLGVGLLMESSHPLR